MINRTRQVIAIACTLVAAGAAQAIEVSRGASFNGPSFAHEEYKESSKPWDAYSDPNCETVSASTVTFHTTAYGSSKSREDEKEQTSFGLVHKAKEYNDEKYEGSHFKEYGQQSHWKPEYYENCTPVPEPQTYALLLAGLGLMTVVARRRKVLAK